MEWNEVLYTLNESGILRLSDIVEILKLPRIRDEIFSEYDLFGYLPQEINISEGINLITIPLNLISISANRTLSIRFCLIPSLKDISQGFWGDRVFIFNEQCGWENMMQIEVLAKKKFNVQLPNMYLFMKTYHGTFEERARACLQTIKHNYDTYARDIISGKEWDYNAWADPR